jgi:hypothetical protein
MLHRDEGCNALTVVPRSLEFPESEHHKGFVVLFVSFTPQDSLGCEFGRIQVPEERFQVFSNVTLLCGHLTPGNSTRFYLIPWVSRISRHARLRCQGNRLNQVGSLFLTLPTLGVTGQQIICSDG